MARILPLDSQLSGLNPIKSPIFWLNPIKSPIFWIKSHKITNFLALNPIKSPFSWTCALFLRPRSTRCCDTPRATALPTARAARWRSGRRSADSAPRRNGRGPGSWSAGGSARSCFDGSPCYTIQLWPFISYNWL